MCARDTFYYCKRALCDAPSAAHRSAVERMLEAIRHSGVFELRFDEYEARSVDQRLVSVGKLVDRYSAVSTLSRTTLRA